jgi:hypothetical protein
VRGVRLSSSGSYLPPTRGGGRAALPVNNGTEGPGRCVVIDFESDLFVGTAMMRIKKARAPPRSPDGDANDPAAVDGDVDADGGTSSGSYYFRDKKRTFQGVVRGRFKLRGVPMSECVTGQVFHRPAGRMPPWFVVNGAMSIIRNLAPQMQASLDCDRPRFLSPLVSTAQTVSSRSRRGRAGGTGPDGDGGDDDDDGDDDASADGGDSIEAAMEEPQPSDPSSLLRKLLVPRPESVGRSFELPADSDRVARRVKARKRAFNGLRAQGDASPTFDPDREYTFEFFQHLLLFDELALDLARPVGKWPLRRMLDGQPIKFMAAHQVVRDGAGGIGPTGTKAIDEEMRWLWSFDLWHESLYEDAIDRDAECTQSSKSRRMYTM